MNTTTTVYRCPGDDQPIDRAVHRARLAAFFPACRLCPHRDDTDGMSTRRARSVQEVAARGTGGLRVDDQSLFAGPGGTGEGLSRKDARDAAFLLAAGMIAAARRQSEVGDRRRPTIVVAHDGREAAQRLVPVVVEGCLRAGCDVSDVSAQVTAALTLAIAASDASGGILIGGSPIARSAVGMTLFAGATSISAGYGLDALLGLLLAPDREKTIAAQTVRQQGLLHRTDATGPYVATLAPHYHALRPLRIVLDTTSLAPARYLRALTRAVAVRYVQAPVTDATAAERIKSDSAHLAVRIDRDGETLHTWDEHGQAVQPERLALLIARHLIATTPDRTHKIVLTDDLDDRLARALESHGAIVLRTPASRAAQSAAIREGGTTLGVDSAGRLWRTIRPSKSDKSPVPPVAIAADALWALTLLLKILSRDGRQLSQVLDDETRFE